jgi:hypothetical protein
VAGSLVEATSFAGWGLVVGGGGGNGGVGGGGGGAVGRYALRYIEGAKGPGGPWTDCGGEEEQRGHGGGRELTPVHLSAERRRFSWDNKGYLGGRCSGNV